MTIDFIQGICFGIQKKPNWILMLNNSSIADIIKNVKINSQFENSLASAIISAYEYLAILEFKDLDSNTVYVLKFDNNRSQWLIEIKDSSDAEVSLEEKNELIKDETVKKLIKKVAFNIFNISSKIYIDIVFPEIESGNFLSIDEAKAEALKFFLEDRELKENFEKLKFIK